MIIYITPSLKRSGPTNQLLYQVKFLKSAKIKFMIICLKHSNNISDEWISFIGINPFIVLDLSDKQSWKIIYKSIKNCRDNISLISQGYWGDIFGLCLKLLSSFWLTRKIKWVVSIRAYWPEDYKSLFGPNVKTLIYTSTHLFVAKYADIRIFCSNSLKFKYLKSGNFSNTANSFSIQNIASAPTFKRRLTCAKPTLFYLGSLIPRKNVELVLELSEKLFSQVEHDLLIIGDGILRESLQEKSCSHVKFLGNLSDPWSVIPANSLFVSLSSSEGMPNSVLEALLMGHKTLLSSIPEHLEVRDIFKDHVSIYNEHKTLDYLQQLLLSSFYTPAFPRPIPHQLKPSYYCQNLLKILCND